MPQPLVSYLKWIIRDPITGATLIDPLPHPHQSSFKTYIAQPGTAGSTVVGTFDIPLWGPGTDQYRWAKPMYDQLGLSYMQRAEAYISTSPVDAPGVAGDPVFSGIITKLPQDLTSYAISGHDSLQLAQLARTGRMENFTGRTDQLFSYAMKVYGLVFGDDFTETLLNNYTNPATWALTTRVGYNAISTANNGLIYTNALFANSQYADCAIDGDFSFSIVGGAPPLQYGFGIVAALTDASNYVRGILRENVPGGGQPITYNLELATVIAGVVTTRSTVQNAVQSPNIVQLRLIGVQSGSNYTWRLLVNGQDLNCTYTYAATPSGAVGATNVITTGGTAYLLGSPHAFMFLNKVNIFQPGQIITGAQSINQVLSLQPPIDLYNMAMSTEGAQYRKNPKAGLNNDTLDFYSPVGTDLSKTVRFEEGVNVSAIKVEPNAEPINTALIAASNPGPDHQGIHWRYNLPAIRKHGLLFDLGWISGPVDGLAVRKHADAILLNRATPQQAKTLTVLRDSNHAITSQINNTTGLIWREGDKITLHVPRLGIYNQTSQILGIEFKEGEASMGLTLDQYPRHLDRIMAIDRLKRTVDDMAASSEDYTGFVNGVIRDQRVVIPVNPFTARVYYGAGQVFTNGVETVVNFDTVDYDSSNMWDSTNHRFVIPIAGRYLITAAIAFGATFTRSLMTLKINGVGDSLRICDCGGGASVAGSAKRVFNAGDTVALDVDVLGGANLTNLTGTALTWFTIDFLGA